MLFLCNKIYFLLSCVVTLQGYKLQPAEQMENLLLDVKIQVTEVQSNLSYSVQSVHELAQKSTYLNISSNV